MRILTLNQKNELYELRYRVESLLLGFCEAKTNYTTTIHGERARELYELGRMIGQPMEIIKWLRK